jgi:voltage-gated potassium channel
LLTIATIVSASLMHFAEGNHQPEFFGTIPHSIYWSIITITSGYGNVEPMTKAGVALHSSPASWVCVWPPS